MKQVLIVDDSQTVRNEISQALRAAGFGTVEASDGQIGLELAREQKFSLIILDVNMPRMNGLEFLKVLRNDPQLKELKVFVMTTSGETVDRQTTEQLGISGYMIKPLNYNDNTKRPDSMDAFVEFHLRKILSEG